jgi:ATP-dependent RNA helicase DHX36
MALVRAYEGWKDAEREGSGYEYCWRNFISAQTLQAIHSLRKQFSYILKDADLVDPVTCNSLSHNQSLVRAIICSGLFPGIASVVVRYVNIKNKSDNQIESLLLSVRHYILEYLTWHQVMCSLNFINSGFLSNYM